MIIQVEKKSFVNTVIYFLIKILNSLDMINGNINNFIYSWSLPVVRSIPSKISRNTEAFALVYLKNKLYTQ